MKWLTRRFPSLNFEISILYTLILGAILIVFSGVLYAILFHNIYTELDTELERTSIHIRQSISSYLEVQGETPEDLMFALEKTIANEGERLNRWWFVGFKRKWFSEIDTMDLSQDFINFVSAEGRSLMTSKNMSDELLSIFLNSRTELPINEITFESIVYQDKTIRLINYPFYLANEAFYVIQVGVFQKPVMDLVLNWLQSVMLSIPLILIFTSFIGRLLVKKILQPVQRISAAAQKVSHEDLSSRVKVKRPYVEMNYLIDDFNSMIGRLEKSFKHIEEFSRHVAHELKTPLTIMKGETELALLEKRTSKEYKAVMKVNMEEVDNMLAIVEDLLLLTKVQYQPEIFNFEEFDFAEYFQEICDQIKTLARPKKIKIQTQIAQKILLIRGDQIHLRRLLFNLIGNAIKFTPESGKVKLSVIADKKNIFVSIKDSGPGISQDDLPKIFDQFYRVQSKETGCGLGLSIAQSIAKVHNGTIDVKSQINQGATFTLTLPLQH